MRLIFLLPLVLLLAACSGSQPEPTASRGEVTKSPPTPSISTPALEITPVWTAILTEEVVSTSAEAAVLSTTSPILTTSQKATQTTAESTKTPLETPQYVGEPVIIFQQEGGIMGMLKTWEIFADGTVVSEGSPVCQIDPAVSRDIEVAAGEIGFFESPYTESKNICCDFFTFTLTISSGDGANTVVVSAGDPNMPLEIRDLISSVQEIVTSCESGE